MSERLNKPSASGIPRLVLCPGSWLAEAPFRDKEETSDAAESGTAIALAMESGIDEFLNLTEKDIYGKLEAATNAIRQDWYKTLSVLDGPIKTEVFKEERIWVRGEDLQPITSAKPDFLEIMGEDALLIDDKTGFLDLSPAEEDWQIRCQAIAVKENFPQVKRILAGLLHHRFQTKWDPVTYNEESLAWARTDLLSYIRRAEDPSSPRYAGPQCRYCKARGDCSVRAGWAVMPMAYSNVIGEMGNLSKQDRTALIFEKLNRLSPQALAWVFARKTLAEEFFDAASVRLKEQPEEVLTSLGLELVPNSPTRSVSDVQKAYAILASEGLLTDEEFRKLCKVGIGQVEEVVVPRLQAKHFETTKEKLSEEAGKKLLAEKLAPAVTLIPKAKSLKPIKPKKK